MYIEHAHAHSAAFTILGNGDKYSGYLVSTHDSRTPFQNKARMRI